MNKIKRPFVFGSFLLGAILASPTAPGFGQTPESKPKATGSISGRVTNGEKPVAGIVVIATNQNSQVQVGQSKTDPEGNYRIPGLPPGVVNLTPVAPVYVLPNPVFNQGRLVDLATDETVEGIDFKLTRGGVITGRVTDADGRPVIEERISLTQVDEKGAPAPGANPVWVNYTMYTTDDRGVYRLYGLSPGRYKVSAGQESGEMPGTRASGYHKKSFYPDTPDVTKAGIVEVTADSEAKNIDIKLGPRAATYAVTGRVIDSDNNQPLPGIQFSLGTVQQSQSQSFVGSSFGPGTPTNSQGEFRVEGITPGRYAFIIDPGSQPTNASGPEVYAEPVPFEIQDSDVTNLEIKVSRGLSISGVVIAEGVTDPNVLTRLSRLKIGCSFVPGPTEIRTYGGGAVSPVNPDGSFSLEGIRAGKVSLNVVGTAAQGFTMTRIERNGVVMGREIDLPTGQHLTGFKIYLAFGASVVRGQVKVVGGTLPNNVLIFVSLMRQGEGTRLSGQADSRGQFVIKNVPVGNYDAVMILASPGSELPRGIPQQLRQPIVVGDGVDTEVMFTLDLTAKDRPE
jgi:protocatechuate 3,4-dioxygenase beta subunit